MAHIGVQHIDPDKNPEILIVARSMMYEPNAIWATAEFISNPKISSSYYRIAGADVTFRYEDGDFEVRHPLAITYERGNPKDELSVKTEYLRSIGELFKYVTKRSFEVSNDGALMTFDEVDEVDAKRRLTFLRQTYEIEDVVHASSEINLREDEVREALGNKTYVDLAHVIEAFGSLDVPAAATYGLLETRFK